jgi:putative ABC transport system permease protein
MSLPLTYNIRNLRVRWLVTLLAIVGIALVVAVFVILSAVASGFRFALRSTGRPDNVIVLQRAATSEITSGVPLAHANLLVVDDRVARDGKGQPLASPEIALVANLPRLSDGAQMNVLLRGVTPRAFEVRGGISMVAGRPFKPGLYEVIVGTHVRDRYGLDIGKPLVLQRQTWQVVGVFASEGNGFESEIWGDVDVMGPAFDRVGGFQSLVLRLKDPASFDAFKRTVETNPQMQLEMRREMEFYDAQAGPTVAGMTGLTWFVSIIMAVGAVVGAMNTMYAIVAARTREIGTLRALGFTRVSIMSAFVLESLALALVGGLLGCLLALPANGLTASGGLGQFSDLSFAFRITPLALTVGIVFALIMGLLGGFLPALRAARLPITAALREA